MRSIALIILAVGLGLSTYGQEIEMDEKARKKYVRSGETADAKEGDEKSKGEAASKEQGTMAYIVLELQRLDAEGPYRLRIDKGNNSLSSATKSLDIAALERFEKGGMAIESEIDLLNYLSEKGWDVVSIVHKSASAIQRGEVSLIYIRRVMNP